MEMWTIAGLMLVLLTFVVLGMFTYTASGKYLNADVFSLWMCDTTGRTVCSDDATAIRSTMDLVEAINYVCGEEIPPSVYINTAETCANPSCSVTTRTATLKSFYLPQGVTGLQDWIPGNGDPAYLTYYEKFPEGEDLSWASALKMEFMSMIVNGVTVAAGGVGSFRVLNTIRSTEATASGLSLLYGDQVPSAVKNMLVTEASKVSSKGGLAIVVGKFSKGKFIDAIKACVAAGTCRELINLGVAAGKVGDDQISEYVASYLEKFLVCQSNSLCLKKPGIAGLDKIDVFPLSEKCRSKFPVDANGNGGVYIELEKLFDRNTRMYMASPCYAKVNVVQGMCDGTVETVPAAGEADTVTVLNAPPPQPPSNIDQCGTDYGYMYEGDLSPAAFDPTICTWSTPETQPVPQSPCIKVEPIGTLGEQNFCYTPAAYFADAKVAMGAGAEAASLVCTGLTIAVVPTMGATAPFAAGCWAIDAMLSVGWFVGLETSSWPHGCLKTDTPPYWTCAS